jgi:hypothetical protein
MNLLLLAQLLLASPASPGQLPAAAPACADGVRLARKAQLPRGAAEALGFAMAEAGARFNAGDVVTPETRGLPFARFIEAQRCGRLLRIDYEQGGIGYFRRSVLLRRTGKAWRLVQP